LSTYPAAALILSAAHARQFPPDVGVEVAFAGRSNSGKSSAINAITNKHGLARTSKTPGRTRLLNFFLLAPGCRIVDLPGYGYAEASAAERATWVPMTTALAQRASLHGLFLMIDSRRGVQEGDEGLMAWAADAGCEIHVLFTKVDKLRRAELTSAMKEARSQLGERATLQAFSASDGTGVEEARRQLHRWFQATPVADARDAH
jgi:GTP-binding protein